MAVRRSTRWSLARAKNPRCYKDVKNPSVKYDANENAWMTAELWNDWHVDNKMRSKKEKSLCWLTTVPYH